MRRRFAFPEVATNGRCARRAVQDRCSGRFELFLSIFVEHANDDAFDLMPGHSYFLETDDAVARQRLKVALEPLLDEYLAQGYVASFAEPLRSYLQWD